MDRVTRNGHLHSPNIDDKADTGMTGSAATRWFRKARRDRRPSR
jgi:hypothetical protein